MRPVNRGMEEKVNNPTRWRPDDSRNVRTVSESPGDISGAWNSAGNFSHLRRMALNLRKREKSAKPGIANKRLLAGRDQDYLLKLLTG